MKSKACEQFIKTEELSTVKAVLGGRKVAVSAARRHHQGRSSITTTWTLDGKRTSIEAVRASLRPGS